ncbi:hypothetical protein ACFQ0B_44730 [Nonomuraea thailandensis]
MAGGGRRGGAVAAPANVMAVMSSPTVEGMDVAMSVPFQAGYVSTTPIAPLAIVLVQREPNAILRSSITQRKPQYTQENAPNIAMGMRMNAKHQA